MAESTKKASPDTWGQVEGFCTKTVSATNVQMLNRWMKAYFHPAEAYAVEKKNAGMGEIVTQVLVMTIISAVAGALSSLIMAFTAYGGMGRALALPVIGMSIAAGAVLGFVGFFLVSLLYLIVAKVLGGKGGYATQSLGLALVSGGTLLLLAPLQVLGAIPCLGIVFSLVAMVFGIFGLISQYRMLKAVHELSQMRTIGVMLVSWAIIVAIMVVVMLVVGAALLGAMGLGALASGMGRY